MFGIDEMARECGVSVAEQLGDVIRLVRIKHTSELKDECDYLLDCKGTYDKDDPRWLVVRWEAVGSMLRSVLGYESFLVRDEDEVDVAITYPLYSLAGF